jgi:hypothetical protein
MVESVNPAGRLAHLRRELAMVNDRNEIGVVVQVPELGRDIAEVHVDGDCRQLERGEHALDVFGAVQQLQPDVLTGTDPAFGQSVGEPVGALVQLREGQSPRGRHDHLTVGDRVGDSLVKVGQVEPAHRANI